MTHEHPANELETLRQAVAASPILVASALATLIPDWEIIRHSSEVDAIVLAWIASHGHGGRCRRAH